MTPKLIETLKTTIYSPKHTKKTEIHFESFKRLNIFKNPYFSKSLSSSFSADFHGPPLAGLKFQYIYIYTPPRQYMYLYMCLYLCVPLNAFLTIRP